MSLFYATNEKSKQLFFLLILLSLMFYVSPALGNMMVQEQAQAAAVNAAPDYSENAPGQVTNPFPFNLPEQFSAPALGDMDGDGDLDMLGGNEAGGLLYFENTGSTTAPAFVQQTGTNNPFDGLTILENGKTAPGIVDYNGDGLLDVLVGDQDGNWTYFENTGDANNPAFTETTLPAGLVDVGNRTQPVFADIDGDGDQDMVTGEFNGAVFYFQNNGSGFTQISGGANPFGLIALGAETLTKPALGDVDLDGDLDLVLGSVDGMLQYYENTGDVNNPAFSLVTGTDSPFDGFDAGDESAPIIADLTAGNGVDVVVGNTFGDYYYYINADPLPVELTAFNAVLDRDDVLLSWETASETNNAGFEVQQYIAGSFQSVGWVNGAGTTTETRNYSYTVSKVAHGSHRFRLKQVDFDGAFAYSSVSEVARPLSGRYTVDGTHPNPFNPQATFNLTIATDQQVTVAVYDMQGKMVGLLHSGHLDAQQPHQFTIDGSNWASGNYLVRIVGENFNDTQMITLLK